MSAPTCPAWLSEEHAGRPLADLPHLTIVELLAATIRHIEAGEADDDLDTLDQREVCRLLHCSRTALYAGRQRGDIPEPIQVGRKLLWKRSDIVALLSLNPKSTH